MRHAARILTVLGVMVVLGAAPRQDAVLSPIAWNGMQLSLSNVRSHENLTLVLIRSNGVKEAGVVPVTLALKKRWLRVGEGRSATVNTLQARNVGRQPILIQDGDRFRGGQQDRIAGIPVVLPPQTPSTPLPCYCVEHSRWSGGSAFGSSRSPALAPKAIRYAAKVSTKQADVWTAVAKVKKEAAEKFGIASKTSNLNELMDHSRVRRMVDGFSKKLGKAADEDPDSIGIALFVKGRLEEIRIYPDHALFAALYPEVLRSYGLESKLSNGGTKSGDTLKAVENRIRGSIKERGKVVRKDRWNSLRVAKMKDGVCSEARYMGRTVLLEWLAKPRAR